MAKRLETEEGALLSTTASICPECMERIPAHRVARGDTVFLEKSCPEHGFFRTKIWQGLPSFETWVRPKVPGTINNPFTEVKRGCPYDCGLCSAHRQHTCTAIIEVTGRCNLHCTFCFADAGGNSADPDLDQIKSWFQSLLNTGGPYNVQISGGEPTVRNDLPEIVALGRSMGFNFLQLNTNGLRLGRDPKFLEALKQAGLNSLFLQFDGTEPEIYRKLRGGDFLATKLETIRRCGELGIGVVLVPTVVPGVNDHNLGSIIDLALANLPTVRGVHFQPTSYFGRIPQTPTDEMRITLSEVIGRIAQQTNGRIKMENFRPSGCENALCSFHGNFILMPDGDLMGTSKHESAKSCCSPPELAVEGAKKAREFVAVHWSGSAPSAAEQGCGCNGSCSEPTGRVPLPLLQTDQDCGCNGSCSDPSGRVPDAPVQLGSLDLFLERARTHSLTISAMAFMDAWNFDLERLMDCCIHTVAPDGKLIPFCAYNVTDKTGRSLYRGC